MASPEETDVDLRALVQTPNAWRMALIASAMIAGVVSGPALAQQESDGKPATAATGSSTAGQPRLEIELNRLEQRDKACRLSLVYRNLLGTALESLQLEAVLFDRDQRVDRFIVLSSKALPVNKMRVQQFDIGGLDCGNLGSILVNDVKACGGEGLTPETCLGKLSLSSKGEAQLLSSVAE